MSAGTPDERRTWQITDFANNRNAYWSIEIWGREPRMLVRVTHGRVGAKPAKDAAAKPMSLRALQTLIQSKEAKGYREVTLTASGAISGVQISDGRALLRLAQREYDQRDWARLMQTIERYCSTIPTRLPAQIDAQDVARMFAVNLAAQTTRLDQLAVAAGIGVPVAPQVAPMITRPAQRTPVRPEPEVERQARPAASGALDWSALWLSSSDAARMARDGVPLPTTVVLSADTAREAREDGFSFAELGVDAVVRDERTG